MLNNTLILSQIVMDRLSQALARGQRSAGGGVMQILRYATASAFGLLLWLTPIPLQAQVPEVVKFCAHSVGFKMVCIGVGKGVEKAVEVRLDSLIKYAMDGKRPHL